MSSIISIFFTIIFSYVYWYCFEKFDTKSAFYVAFAIAIVRGYIINGGIASFLVIIAHALILAGINTLLCRIAYDRTSSFWGFFIASLIIGFLSSFVAVIVLAFLGSMIYAIA